MTRYAVTSLAAALVALTTNVAAAVEAAHPDCKDWVQRDCEHRNAIIALLSGKGAFAGDYAVEGEPTPLNAGNETVQICLDSMAQHLLNMCSDSPHTGMNAAMARGRLATIARIEPTHPVVQHWTVVRDACYTGTVDVPDWAEIALAVEAGNAAVAAAQAEAEWRRYAAAAREAEAAHVAAVEAAARKDAEFRAASLSAVGL